MTKKSSITTSKSNDSRPLLARMADEFDERLRGLGFTVTVETPSRTDKSVVRFVHRRSDPAQPPAASQPGSRDESGPPIRLPSERRQISEQSGSDPGHEDASPDSQ